MGIDVDTRKRIFYNGSHQELINTSVSKNPSEIRPRGHSIQSIFRRRQSKTKESDGNPLIYALKHKSGYSISLTEILEFLPPFYSILDKALMSLPANTVIVPLPSAHQINKFLAIRAQRRLTQSIIEWDVFSKKTVSEVLSDLDLSQYPTPVRLKMAKRLAHDLSRAESNKPFSMKEVPDRKIRRSINPLKLRADFIVTSQNYLLIDDLYASGSTIMSAINLLKYIDNSLDIRGLCLLSRL